MSLMVLKAILSYREGHCKGRAHTVIQTYLTRTMPASNQVEGFLFPKYFNVAIFCANVPKRGIWKPKALLIESFYSLLG